MRIVYVWSWTIRYSAFRAGVFENTTFVYFSEAYNMDMEIKRRGFER